MCIRNHILQLESNVGCFAIDSLLKHDGAGFRLINTNSFPKNKLQD